MILFETQKAVIFRDTDEGQPFDLAVDQGETHNLWDMTVAADVNATRRREMNNCYVESAVRTHDRRHPIVLPLGEAAWE